jgi:VPDSG-CTERM motif
MKKNANAVVAILAVALVGCGVLCEQAQAVPITGSIQFMGSATPSGASPGTPVTVHFTNPSWHTIGTTGVYGTLAIPNGTAATFSDFSFTGDGLSAALSAGVSPLWTFTLGTTIFSFDLMKLSNGHTEPGSMSFTGTGTAHITGFDDTLATIGFQGAGQNFNFQFSSSTTTSRGNVPETGTTIALLAIGLAGIVMLRRQLNPV